MPSQLSRREFLKLAGTLPLANLALSGPLSQLPVQPGAARGAASYPNIIIVVLDSLSAENMSL